MNLMVCAGNTVDVSEVPEEIRILPFGHVKSTKGDFTVDEESFELIRKKFKDRKLDLVIDYEHQTLQDIQAPAGGWIKDLIKGDDAIIAKVEWTPKAKEYLQNKEYRYLSPVVLVRKRDAKAVVLHSVALTNTPAIDGMFPIINSVDIEDYDDSEGGHEMELSKLIKLLGLPEGATEADVETALASVQAAKESGKEADPAGEATETVANSTILSLLGLKDDAKTEDVTASIMALKAGDAKIQEDIRVLKEQIAKREADDLIEKALKEGKIPAAQKEWAESYALKDPEGFKMFLDKAPAVVPLKKMELTDAPDAEVEVDPMILKNLGMTKEDIKKYAKKED